MLSAIDLKKGMKMNLIVKENCEERGYIKRLRNDPRTKALFDSFVYQAMVETRESIGSHASAERFAHEAAERAVALAMGFVLDTDGEYLMVLGELDRMRNMIRAQSNIIAPKTYNA